MKVYLKQGESVPFLDGLYTAPFSGWYSLSDKHIILFQKANCGSSMCFTNEEDGDKVEEGI